MAGSMLMQLQPFVDALGALAGILLFVLMLLGVVHCFLGGVLFKALVLIDATVVGAVAGSALLAALRPAAGGFDYFVAVVAGMILLGLLAWFAPRWAFAALAGIAALVAVLILGWVLATIAAVAAFAAGYVYFRRLSVILTSGFGAAFAVFSAVGMAMGADDSLWEALAGEESSFIGALIALVVWAALTVGGVFVQVKLLDLIRTSLTPEHVLRDQRRRGKATVRPRFSRF